MGAPADPAAPAPTGAAGAPDGAAAPTGPAARKTTAPAAGGTKTQQAAPKPPAAPAGLRSGTYTGSGVSHEYGTVQVTITVAGGVVTKASATFPTDRSTSRSINNGAVPTLNSRAVAAKTSSNIQSVSGATLTSDAYKSSLQSALDKAK
ncbi:FMN-binding protein [Micromonospora zhanjiangensis]